MMPLYYIAPLATVRAHQDYFRDGCHMVWADQEAGTVLVKIRFFTEGDELHWREQPGVEPLPHPVFEQDVPIEDKHVEKLKKEHGIKKGDKIHDVIRRVSDKTNPHSTPLMRLHVL